MAVPFSNTHLRVPRGFGTILEGLAREVLRDQPEDIPTYAMEYFNALLKQREECGMDPAEWAARLEDRYYNNHAFKNTEASHENESEPEATISEGKSHESQTDDEASHSAEVSALSITQPDFSEKDDSTEGSDEDEKVNITERFTLATEEQRSKRHSVAARQSDEESNTDDEKDPPETAFDQVERPNMEMDDDPISDENLSQFHSELTDLLSFKEIHSVDLFSHESEDDEDDHQGGALVENKIVDSEEENTDVTEAVEAVPYSGPADVDICAAELGRSENPLERCSAQDNTYVDEDEDESLNLQLDTELSHYEISQGNQQEAEDQAQNINEGEIFDTGASHEESNESSALIENNLDDNPILKEDSLVEVSFEDVPEAQHITEDGEEMLMEDASVEILQNTELEMEQTEESIELTTSLADPNISNTEEQLKPEMEEVKKDVISEDEEIESHHASFDITKEKVDTNNSNLHDADNGERTSTMANLDETGEEMEKQEIASLTHSADWTAADSEEEEGPHEYEKDATASANKSDEEECSRPQEEEDIMDIPLDDPEANRAAAKIQAGFRGHMTRKKMKPEDKTEGEEVSSTGDVLNSSQGVSETGRSGAVERDDTSVPEQ